MHSARTGTAHSARAALEAALAADDDDDDYISSASSSSSSVELWARYVRFSRGRRELRARARDVLYRAVAACPWAKELYMEAFRAPPGEFSAAELRAVFDSLVAKGLRVHVDLDEFLAARGEGRGKGVGAEEREGEREGGTGRAVG